MIFEPGLCYWYPCIRTDIGTDRVCACILLEASIIVGNDISGLTSGRNRKPCVATCRYDAVIDVTCISRVRLFAKCKRDTSRKDSSRASVRVFPIYGVVFHYFHSQVSHIALHRTVTRSILDAGVCYHRYRSKNSNDYDDDK